MRHGQAANFAVSDAERSLTEQGIQEVNLMAKWLKKLPFEFDQILVSPYRRAQQTANTVSLALNSKPKLVVLDFITPSGDARELHDYIDGICISSKINSVLVVSHMPLVSYVVAELTNEHTAPIFQTAAIAEISYDVKKMTGNFRQVVTPNDLS